MYIYNIEFYINSRIDLVNGNISGALQEKKRLAYLALCLDRERACVHPFACVL